MTELELASILKCIDDALDVFRNYRGPLSPAEISIKSMLTVLRAQVAEYLTRERSGTLD